jgi:glucokinase
MVELAIDLGGTAVKLGVFESGQVLETSEFGITGGFDLDDVVEAANVLLSERSPMGVAIAVPGIVDPDGRRLLAAHGKYAELRDVDLGEWSRTTFGVESVVENDARAALLGELAAGSAQGERDAVLITLGTGIGTAAVIDGHVLRGAHGHAGVLSGHVTVDLDGPRCPCGNLGCAEALASTWALDRDLRGDGGSRGDSGRVAVGPELQRRVGTAAPLGIRDLIETLYETESATILDRYLRIWGAVIVTQCHAFDPSVVVVTGGVMRARDTVLPALAEYVQEHLWSSSFRPRFVTPDEPELSVLRGLAALALDSATTRDANDA